MNIYIVRIILLHKMFDFLHNYNESANEIQET